MLERVATLLLAAALTTVGCKPDEPTPAQPLVVEIDAQRFRVPLFDDDQALGGDAPLVTVVVFTDYACPPCHKTWKVMRNLVEDYDQDLRVVFRSHTVPGFGRGEQAVEAAFAAGAQGKFWDMHWRLFEAQNNFERPALRAHAEALGLDVPRFVDDLDTGAHSGPRVRHRRQSKGLAIPGLPAAFVNGLFVIGYQDEKAWHALIDAEVRRVREMIASGTPRSKLYETIMQTAVAGRVGASEHADEMRADLDAKAKAAAPKKVVNRPKPDERYQVLPTALSRGPDDAPVVVVEFMDFECPFCRKAWNQEVAAVLDKYEGDVRFSIRNLPLEIHTSARGAAKAGLAAQRQGKFWPFHDRLIAHTGVLGRSVFVDMARELGMDTDRFLRDLDDPALAKSVADDVVLANRLGVTGTPGFFVNGRYVRGFTPGVLTGTIETELATAKGKIDQGIARGQVFEVLMQEALPPERFPNPG